MSHQFILCALPLGKGVLMKTALLFLAVLMVGCMDEPRQYENYGDITAGVGGIAITSQAEHPYGWGRSDCLSCHNTLNIHKNPNSTIDENAIIQLVKQNGVRYCLTCHGPNGVP